MSFIPKLLSWSKWRIRDGNIFFWRDTWLKSSPLVDEVPITDCPSLQVRECRINNGWDVDLLRSLVGENKLEEILNCIGGTKKGQIC